jgi:HK97 family phage prohead protease
VDQVNNEVLCWIGDAVKASSDGKFAGYLVRFDDQGNANDTTGEYFTRNTDFGRPMKSGDVFDLNLYYGHGFTDVFGNQVIGHGKVKMDDAGLWYEGQIEINNKYMAKVAQLLKEGRLGLSSGAAPHLVSYNRKGDARKEILSWPIAEASLTPCPAEPRNQVMPVKSLIMDAVKEEKTFKPTSGMKSAAKRAIAWREAGRPGATAVGWARANQIVKGESLSAQTCLRMYSFFSRHEVDKKAKGFSAGEEGYPSPGRVAWDAWGGDAGFSFAKRCRNTIMNNKSMFGAYDPDDMEEEEDDEEESAKAEMESEDEGIPEDESGEEAEDSGALGSIDDEMSLYGLQMLFGRLMSYIANNPDEPEMVGEALDEFADKAKVLISHIDAMGDDFMSQVKSIQLTTVRDFEKWLHTSGRFSKSDAKIIASQGWKQRDVAKAESQSALVEALKASADIDKQIFELSIK